jgi:hypothetical protein
MKKTEKKLKTIQQKHDSGRRLNVKELKFKKSFEEMNSDRAKDPTERYGYVESNAMEEYYVMPGEAKVEKTEDGGKKQKSKTKTSSDTKNGKKNKRTKKTTKDSTSTGKQTTTDSGKLEVAEKDEASEPKKKTAKKRGKKSDGSTETSRPKKKVKNSNSDKKDSKAPAKSKVKNTKKENGIDEKDDTTSSGKGEHVTIVKTPKVEERRLSAYEEFVALGDVSSHGETDDDSIKMDDMESDEDLADKDYVEKPKALAKKTQKKTPKLQKSSSKVKKLTKKESSAKSKDPPKKKVQKTKVKIENAAAKEENGALNLKKLIKKEQRKFHDCEIKFLPLLRRWEKAISDKNEMQLSQIYEELLTCMEHFTAPFIVEYGMNDLMKRSKGYNNELRKQVLSKFKAIYIKKKDEVPKGFKATKESQKYVSPDIKAETTEEEVEHQKASKIPDGKQNSSKTSGATDISQTPQDTPVPIKKEEIPHVMPGPSSQKQRKQEIKLESSSQKQSVSVKKPEMKRKFSLGNLMRTGSSTSQSGGASAKKDESSQLTPRSSKDVQNNPSWTIKVEADVFSSNENRSFGLEFLEQAAMDIPESKTTNYEAVARNIEVAIYKWSGGICNGESKNQEEERWNKYWTKIHDLAACISGKRQDGTLAKMICDGKFASPDELVCLDDDDLLCSFQGLPLPKFGN